jgi:DNA-binding transcriptional ArsR family regulator
MQALTALSDPTRRRIVEMLAERSLSSGEIAGRFSVTAPAVSQHLKVLRNARLVRVRTEGQRRIYELDRDGVEELSDWVARLRLFWGRRLDTLEGLLRKEESS